MAKGGIIMVHDYGLLDGVKNAVDDFAHAHGITHLLLCDVGRSVIIVRG